MEDHDRLPRFSHDLIKYLSEVTPVPSFPTTALGFAGLDEPSMRRAAFMAGARALVDHLVDWLEEQNTSEQEREKADEAGGVLDRPRLRFPRVLGSDGEVREISPPAHMADDTSE